MKGRWPGFVGKKGKARDRTSDRIDEIRLVEVNENLETTDLMRLPTLTSQVFSDILSFTSTNIISSSRQYQFLEVSISMPASLGSSRTWLQFLISTGFWLSSVSFDQR